jgi:hypothetical protein
VLPYPDHLALPKTKRSGATSDPINLACACASGLGWYCAGRAIPHIIQGFPDEHP